jgi:hypothetical protein
MKKDLMPNKMFWDEHDDWKAAEAAWDQKAQELKASHPLKNISKIPNMPGIAETGIKRKGLVYLLRHDKKRFFGAIFSNPLFATPFDFSDPICKNTTTIKGTATFFCMGSLVLKKFIKTQMLYFCSGFLIATSPLNAPPEDLLMSASTTQSMLYADSVLLANAPTQLLAGPKLFGSPPSITSAKKSLTPLLKTPSEMSVFSSPLAKCRLKCSATGAIWWEPKGSASGSTDAFAIQ